MGTLANDVSRQFDRTNAAIGFLVFLGSLLVYALTVAPTVSFWDSGEFIAASYVLGVPHPPGTPLYILLGRLFSILPISSDIAVRVNLLSSVCSAGTALFAYLIAFRILRRWFGKDQTPAARIFIYAGALAGALFTAFSYTNWYNSVEAEVYGMAMCLFAAIVWLGIKYAEEEHLPGAAGIAVLIFFLSAVGIGVHMLVFVALPVFGLQFVLKKGRPDWVWSLLAVYVAFELFLLFALSSRPGEVSYYVPIAIAGVAYFFYMFSFPNIARVKLMIAVGFLLSCSKLFVNAVALILNSGAEPVPGVLAAGHWLGIAAFSLLVLYAVIGFVVDFRKSGSLTGSGLFQWYFVFAGLVMVLALQIPKGYHIFLLLTTLLTALVFIFVRRWVKWPMLVALVSASMIILGLKEFTIGLIAGLAIILFLGLVMRLAGWKTAVAAIVVSVIGFSINAYLPIRASQSPIINESDPSENMHMFTGYLERKQYGSQSMIERMFVRRATWENQFGNFHRIGLWNLLSS